MSGTLEITNNLISVKLTNLEYITNLLCKLDIPAISKIKDVDVNLKNLITSYEMGSIKILADYFLLNQEYHINLVKSTDAPTITNIKNVYNIQNNKLFSIYQTFIKKENFVDKIDRLYSILKNTVSTLIRSNAIDAYINDIKAHFDTYENSTILCIIPNITNNRCNKCSNEMYIISNASEIVCKGCGITEVLYGTVFEDDQFYFQEGQRSKHGAYDPSKHCRFWIERIQAREAKEIPNTVINAVKKCIQRNKIRNVEDITCVEIRKYLSQTCNTLYNEHIPLIRKLITGETPAQLTEQEIQLITIYFDKVIKAYNDVKDDTQTNVPYHPYLIYKIIEHLLNKKDTVDYNKSKKRIFNILSCIHLQSRETLIKNDKIWEKICGNISEIKYIPTDTNCYSDD